MLRILRLIALAPALLLLTACGAIPPAAPTPAQSPALPEQPQATTTENNVVYTRAAGQDLVLHITRPAAIPDKPMPVVIWVHGGGWSRAVSQPHPNRFLAEHGFFTVSVSYRLTPQHPFPAQIHDVKAAVRWLRANAERYHIDPDRIGVWGHSAGGQLAVLLGTSGDLPELEGELPPVGYSTRVHAVVNLAGVIDFLHPTDLQWQEYERIRLFGGPQSEHMDLVRLAMPTEFLDKGDPPVLSIHGTADKNVPLHHSQFLHEKLTAAGIESALEIQQGVDHWLIRYPEGKVTADVEKLVLAFFTRHLRP